MGANWFESRAEGPTAQQAFRAAKEQAQFEHGHGGYTGTLAEKSDFVVIKDLLPQPVTPLQAERQKLRDSKLQLKAFKQSQNKVALRRERQLVRRQQKLHEQLVAIGNELAQLRKETHSAEIIRLQNDMAVYRRHLDQLKTRPEAKQPMSALTRARELAEELSQKDDPRISDKWGPAGCIEYEPGKFLFFGWASS